MRSWKCEKCGQYIPFNIDTIEFNDVVVFNIHNQSRRFRGHLTIHARVLSKSNHFLFVVSGIDFYCIDIKYVYPRDAPVAFIYNMFGECIC